MNFRGRFVALVCLIAGCAAGLAQAQTQLAILAVPAAPVSTTATVVSAFPDAPAPQPDVMAQQSAAPTPEMTPEQQQKLTREEQAARDIKNQEHQRILGIMPAFNSTSNADAVPLTARQKIALSFRSAVDPWQFGITFIAAGIGQAEDSHPGYQQGWEGYGKRYAASYADLFDGTVIGNGLLPAVLHQDPRYFRKGTGSKWYRFFYAASTNFRCKGDNGKWQPNYSNVGGNVISGAISELYYPKSERDFGLVFSNAAVVTLEGAIGSELLEFWPDIHHKLFKNKEDSYTKAADEAIRSAPNTPPAIPKQTEIKPAPVQQ